jgi:hypothetical protein
MSEYALDFEAKDLSCFVDIDRKDDEFHAEFLRSFFTKGSLQYSALAKLYGNVIYRNERKCKKPNAWLVSDVSTERNKRSKRIKIDDEIEDDQEEETQAQELIHVNNLLLLPSSSSKSTKTSSSIPASQDNNDADGTTQEQQQQAINDTSDDDNNDADKTSELKVEDEEEETQAQELIHVNNLLLLSSSSSSTSTKTSSSEPTAQQNNVAQQQQQQQQQAINNTSHDYDDANKTSGLKESQLQEIVSVLTNLSQISNNNTKTHFDQSPEDDVRLKGNNNNTQNRIKSGSTPLQNVSDENQIWKMYCAEFYNSQRKQSFLLNN